jgi:uncharacterized damage-inducible protein DinB
MSLSKTVFLDMFAYGHLTNNRLLDKAVELTPEQWLTPLDAGQRSIYETLFHLLAVEEEWIYFCEHGKPNFDYRALHDYPDVASLRAYADHVSQTTHAYLERLDEETLISSVYGLLPHGAEQSVVIWQVLTHSLLHSTQHRSEVALMLTRYGHSPGEIDIYGYFWLS